MKITQLKINNFRNFETAQIDIPIESQFVFICGENGSGKTSLLQSITIALNGANGIAFNLLNENLSTEIELTVCQNNEKITNKVFRQQYQWSGFQPFENAIGYGVQRLNVTRKSRENWEKINPFHSLYETDKSQLLPIDRWLIDDYLDNGIETQIAKEIKSLLIELMPKTTEIKRKGSQILFCENSIEFSFEQLSHGSKSICALFGDMLIRLIENQKSQIKSISDLEGIVFIDEIELHLHHKTKNHLIYTLEKSFPKIQFWLTQNSMPLLCAPKNSILINTPNNEKQ